MVVCSDNELYFTLSFRCEPDRGFWQHIFTTVIVLSHAFLAYSLNPDFLNVFSLIPSGTKARVTRTWDTRTGGTRTGGTCAGGTGRRERVGTKGIGSALSEI